MKKLLILTTLSMALLSGGAYAQEATGGASGSGGVTGGVSAGGVDADAGAGATGGADVSSDGSGVDANAGANVTGDANATVGDDATTTGSVDADAGASASGDSGFIDGLGDSADDFFAGDDGSELRSDDDITASFDAMSDDEQNELRTNCLDVTANTAEYGPAVVEFCAKIGSMNM